MATQAYRVYGSTGACVNARIIGTGDTEQARKDDVYDQLNTSYAAGDPFNPQGTDADAWSSLEEIR